MTTSSGSTRSGTRQRFVRMPCLLLFAATLAAYFPVLRGGFIWDDDAHVTRPELRSWHGLGRIWTHLGATQQYYPVLHSAFWVEHRLWGDSALGYHLINVLLHATAACLFGLALSRLNGNRTWPWFAAFLFALHPIAVESVAWISEQKNTLSTVFYLLAGLTYLKYSVLTTDNETLARSATFEPRETSMHSRSGTRQRFVLYCLATLLFLLALLSKSVTATLPAALLVVLWWKNGRLSWKRDVLPLIPWFALALAAGLVTAWVERTTIGARGAAFDLSFGQKVMLAGRIVWFYLGKLIWPANLIFIYPRWAVRTWPLWRLLFPFGAVLLLAAAWLVRRRSRGPLAALLFFIGSLFPAVGFFNVYPFIFSYVADHFQYLASLGIFAAFSSALTSTRLFSDHETLARSATFDPPHHEMPVHSRSGTRKRFVRTAFHLGILVALGVLTWRQCRMYRDVETLYRVTLDRNPGAWLAHLNLGNRLLEQDKVGEAMAHYRTAARLEPGYPSTHFNLAKAEMRQGDPSAAVAEFELALRIAPGDAEARNNLGIALAELGRMAEAKAQFETAIRLQPDYARAHSNLGSMLLNEDRPGEAATEYRAAIRIDPALAEPHCNLGLALVKLGRMAEAKGQFAEALRINPGYAAAREALAKLTPTP